MYFCIKSTATGSMQAVGICAFGNTVDHGIEPPCVEGSGMGPPSAVAQPGRVFSTCATRSSLMLPPNVPSDEKSPVRSAAVGVKTVSLDLPCLIRRPSYETKKNVLSFLIGPPKVAPYWFC